MTNNSARAGHGDLRLPRPKGVKTHQGQGMGRDAGRNTVWFARTPNDERRAMVNFQHQRKAPVSTPQVRSRSTCSQA